MRSTVMSPFWKLWIVRLLIGVVLALNLQASIIFIINPEPYTPSFELTGVPGVAAVRGIGILFLMWTIPYFFAVYHPVRYKNFLVASVIMQAIGVLGETLLYLDLPGGYAVLRSSIERFILFDAGGLLLLLLALLMVHISKPNSRKDNHESIPINCP